LTRHVRLFLLLTSFVYDAYCSTGCLSQRVLFKLDAWGCSLEYILTQSPSLSHTTREDGKEKYLAVGPVTDKGRVRILGRLTFENFWLFSSSPSLPFYLHPCLSYQALVFGFSYNSHPPSPRSAFLRAEHPSRPQASRLIVKGKKLQTPGKRARRLGVQGSISHLKTGGVATSCCSESLALPITYSMEDTAQANKSRLIRFTTTNFCCRFLDGRSHWSLRH